MVVTDQAVAGYMPVFADGMPTIHPNSLLLRF
jgi:hypothetical protein